jgi:type VI secretion system secreted protein VgrG
MAERIPGSRDIVVDINDALTVAGDSAVRIGRNSSTRVQDNLTQSANKKIVMEAGDQLELVCGAASITLKKDGTIVIRGKDITLEGSGKVNVKASSDIVLKGSKIQQN